MNMYILVEGEIGAKLVYEKWISYINKNITPVGHISEIETNNFCVFSAGGRPGFFEVIEAAIEDINEHGSIDKFVVAVDCEDLPFNVAKDELQSLLQNKEIRANYDIILHNYCFESWALGNRVLCKRKPNSERLRNYITHYNIAMLDPELMPAYPNEVGNRAQFSAKYLRCMLNERYKNLTYNKNNPQPLLHIKYFEQLKKRNHETGHIPSFASFLHTFTS